MNKEQVLNETLKGQAEIINLYEAKHNKKLFINGSFKDYDINQDTNYLARCDNESPLKEFSNLKDYVDNFDKFNKKHINLLKKAIRDDFKKSGLNVKVKINKGYLNGLNVILQANKDYILDNQDLSYLSEKAINNFNKYEWEYIRSIDYLLNAKENVCSINNLFIIKEWLLNRINYNNYSRYSLVNYDKSKKRIEELFYKDDVINKIIEVSRSILFKYSILKYYDAYGDYNNSNYTIYFDLKLELL